MDSVDWSDLEKQVARAAFDKAYERETSALIREVCDRSRTVTHLNEVWELHDFLSARRHEIDGKYDYRSSALIFGFAQLIREGWLHLKELEGLHAEKLSKIAALTRML